MSDSILKDFDRLREEGASVFSEIYSADSDVRHLSEARRENSAAEYSASAVDHAAAAMLERSVEQSAEVIREFAAQPLSDD